MIERREGPLSDAPDADAPSGSPLPLRARSTALATREPEPREWLLPGADELFRGIYTRAGMDSCQVLAVCSAIDGEGKTTVSLGLATTIAQDFPERRVLVLETDLQRPSLAADFNVEPAPGLIEHLVHDQPIELAIRPTFLNNLDVVPAGGPSGSPGRLLRSDRLALAVDMMRDGHDVIILDLPALLVNSDALLLTDLADGIVFVVRAGVTPSSLIHKAIGQLDQDKLRGVVLNGERSAVPGWVRRLLGL